MNKLAKVYTNSALILLNTFVLFIIINFVAAIIPHPINDSITTKTFHTAQAFYKKYPENLNRIYQGKSSEDVQSLINFPPTFKAHPTLEFTTTPLSNKNYQTGNENCRLNKYITLNNFAHKINNAIWILGGSTTFGFGVSGNETIDYFLNSFDKENTYINFGSLSYHQKSEIEKLILLLQKGFRPKKVIFLDGLNDLYKITESNFNEMETPSLLPNAYANDFGIGSKGNKLGLIYSLPIIKLYYQYLAKYYIKNEPNSIENLSRINFSDDLYNTNPILHYYANEFCKNEPIDTLEGSKKLFRYYYSNQKLIEALSQYYHFEYYIFMQPIGTFNSDNPFIKNWSDFITNIRLYKNVKPVYSSLINVVKQNKIPHFYDLSFADKFISYPYVDLTHYSKSMNELLAKFMLTHVQKQTRAIGCNTNVSK